MTLVLRHGQETVLGGWGRTELREGRPGGLWLAPVQPGHPKNWTVTKHELAKTVCWNERWYPPFDRVKTLPTGDR